MQPSWRFALNTLAGKPGRTALMVAAVAIAAALVVSMSCSIGSVQASLEVNIVKLLGAADLRIIHQGNGRFEDQWLERVRQWPEVELATGRLLAPLTLIRADGKRSAETGLPLRVTPNAIGVELDLEPRFRLPELLRGSWPTAPDEIAIDPMTAEQLQAEVGDVLEVQRFGEPVQLRVAAIFERPRLGVMQRALIQLDRRTLAEATDRPGDITTIAIMLRQNEDVPGFRAKYEHELPAELALEEAETVRAGFDRQVHASRVGFLIASILTFTCASFIIVTALTTSVAQRQREMAVARCVGASRAQLFGSQVIVGLLMASTGAVIGVPVGIGLTALLVLSFHELLPSGLDVNWFGIRLAVIGAAAAGVAGALYPAWMASRVSPLQAMTFQARPPRLSSIVACACVGIVLIGIQLALFGIDDPGNRFYAYIYAGLPLLHIGYFIVAVPVLIGMTFAAGGLLSALLRLPRGMLRGSLRATPFRHGFTAGALMVGISILVSTWANAMSIMDDWLGNVRFADGFVYRITGITDDERRTIENLPYVTRSCPISLLPVRVLDRQIFGIEGLTTNFVTCWGFEPAAFFSMNAVEWVAGDPQRAIIRLEQGDAVIVADRFLTTQKVGIGDRLTLGVGERVRKEFEIVGAVNSAGLDIATAAFGIRNQYMDFSISSVFLDYQTLASSFAAHEIVGMQLQLSPDVDDERVIEDVGQAAPGAQFMSGRWILESINQIAIALLTVQSAIAFAALVLACIGMGNVIMANIHARRFEYGVLRAVGGGRGLLARLILGESTILALTGALIGTMLGLHLAWVGVVHYRSLAGLPMQWVIPIGPTLAGWLVLLGLTLLASLPGVLSVIRPRPSTLLAAGRHGV